MPDCTRSASTRLAVLVISAVLATAPLLDAQQRRGGRDGATQAAGDMASVRAELAAVLLQSKKYDEAAREYRALVGRDTSNFDYRLGLARALAWGGRPRDAERELVVLQSKKLQPATIDSMLRAAREAIVPRQWEAAAWVAERRDFAPYRLAYARALIRERYYWLGVVQYDTLLSGTWIGALPEPVVLRREQARAYLDAGDRDAGAARLRDVLHYTPADSGIRHELAVILADGRALPEARAHYDTLISATPTPVLYTERGRLRLTMRDTVGAQGDLMSAHGLGGTVAAYLMLGGIYADRRDYRLARTMYRAALDMPDDDDSDPIAVYAAIARLAREERPVIAFAPWLGNDPGWTVTSDGIGDNLGVHFASSRVRRTFAFGDATCLSLAAVHQYLGERSDVRKIDLNGAGGEASLSSGLGYGPVLWRLGVTGGQLKLPDGRSMTTYSGATAWWINAWQLGAQWSTGPAYTSLLTTTSVQPETGSRNALTEQDATAMLGGPIKALDVAIMGQQSLLSDGNRRKTLQGYLRVPLVPGFAAIYSASHVTFSQRSLRYWDPFSYESHALGLELATGDPRGFSMAVRALPGKAWSVEPPPPLVRVLRNTRLPERIHRSAVQINTSGEVTWHEPYWEGTVGLTYGQGRVTDYRRFGVTLGVRILQ